MAADRFPVRQVLAHKKDERITLRSSPHRDYIRQKEDIMTAYLADALDKRAETGCHRCSTQTDEEGS